MVIQFLHTLTLLFQVLPNWNIFCCRIELEVVTLSNCCVTDKTKHNCMKPKSLYYVHIFCGLGIWKRHSTDSLYLLNNSEVSAEKTQRLEVTQRLGMESVKSSPTHRYRQ